MKSLTAFDEEGKGAAGSYGPSRPIHVTIDDEREFIRAVQDYKERSGRLFPTCSELLEIIQSLGYAKRIWKPVAIHCGALDGIDPTGLPTSDAVGLVGWYSTVETPILP